MQRRKSAPWPAQVTEIPKLKTSNYSDLGTLEIPAKTVMEMANLSLKILQTASTGNEPKDMWLNWRRLLIECGHSIDITFRPRKPGEHLASMYLIQPDGRSVLEIRDAVDSKKLLLLGEIHNGKLYIDYINIYELPKNGASLVAFLKSSTQAASDQEKSLKWIMSNPKIISLKQILRFQSECNG